MPTTDQSVGIVDYGRGNLGSVTKACQVLGYRPRLIRNGRDLADRPPSRLVFPGVGAFGDCAAGLARRGLAGPLRAWIQADRPLLGICLGYQILFESSEESPDAPGLGIFPGRVKRFPPGLKVPHMGWNNVTWKGPWAKVMGNPGGHYYFVHSYYPAPRDRKLVRVTCGYGLDFAAGIGRGRLAAVQFHPEKSQRLGLEFLRRFLDGDLAVRP